MAFVHPAAVAPLALGRRRFLDGAALIAGSVGADFEYFATLSATQRVHPHPLAVFVAGVVVGAALVAVLDVAGPGISAALPPFLAGPFGPALVRPLGTRNRNKAGVVVALIVGAASHALWDALAERHGALAHGVPWRAIATWSTPAGVAVVVVCALVAVMRGAPSQSPSSSWTRAFAALVVAGAAGAGLAALARAFVLDGGAGGDTRDVMAAASGGAIFAVLTGGAVITRMQRRGNADRSNAQLAR